MNFVFLEITIGLVFIYLLLSLFSTIIMEMIATLFRMRASLLKTTIERLLNDSNNNASIDFFNQPLMKNLSDYKTWWSSSFNVGDTPSNISAQNFSNTIINLILKDQMDEIELSRITENLAQTSFSKDAKTHIESLIRNSKGNYECFQKGLEDWYNDTMERANGWYKRQVQYILLFVGFCIAFAFNADSIEIIQKLQSDPATRIAIVNNATSFIQKNDTLKTTNHFNTNDSIAMDSIKKLVVNENYKLLNESNNILGWKSYHSKNSNWGLKILGFMLTALAICLGASFWFDLLKKLINIRTMGKSLNEEKSI